MIIVLLGIRLHNVLTTDIKIPTKASAVSPQKIDKKLTKKSDRINSSSYDVIASKNLFHPSRSTAQKPSEVSRPVSKNDIPQLFGTIITNDKKLAILEDQSSKRSTLYKVNDSVAGFVVSQILENKVILLKDGESIEVTLRADKKFKKSKRTQTRQRTIRKAPKQRKSPSRVRRSRPQREGVLL